MKNNDQIENMLFALLIVFAVMLLAISVYCGLLREENHKLLSANAELHKSFYSLDASFNKLDGAFKKMESAKDDAVYMLRCWDLSSMRGIRKSFKEAK